MDVSRLVVKFQRFLDGKFMMMLLCFIIFLSGIIFSLIFSDKVTVDAVGAFLNYLGSLATFLAAIAAFLAIQDWRHQFAHKERFAALIRLRAGVEKLGNMIWLANSVHSIYLGSFATKTDVEKSAAFQEESRKFSVFHEEYKTTLKEVEVFLSAKELEDFPGRREEIEKLVVKIVLIVNSVINEEDLEGTVKEYVNKVMNHEDEIRRVIKQADEYLLNVLRRES